MRPSRREFVKWVTASGIALSLSRLGAAEPAGFPARPTLPGRGGWNPAADGAGRIDGVVKVTGAKLYTSDFRAADLPGWPTATSHAILVRAPDATHVYTGMDLARLSGTAKPSVVVTAEDLARIGTRVPEFYAGDLFCPIGKTPIYMGQPVALLIFETFDAFDRARLALRDGTFVKSGEETGPVALPNYAAFRFTRVAGATPDAPDIYSPIQAGWVTPGHFQDTPLPVWEPFARETLAPYGKAATYGEQIRAELDANNPALLVLDRAFETQSVDPMFLEPESGLGWYNRKGDQLELVIGVQSPYEATEAIAFMLGKARAPFKPSRINSQFTYLGGSFGGRDHTPFLLYVALAAVFFPGRPVRLAHDRYQQFQGGIKRHPFKIGRESAVDRSTGKIKAFAADHVLDGGGLANFSSNVASVSAIAAIGVYDIPKVDITTVAVHSRGVTAGSMRCYGTLQTMTALEVLIDEAAAALPLNPIEFRRRNALKPNGRTITGNHYSVAVRTPEILDKMETHAIWRQRAEEKARLQQTGFSSAPASPAPPRITVPAATVRSGAWNSAPRDGFRSIAIMSKWAMASGPRWPTAWRFISAAWPTKCRSRGSTRYDALALVTSGDPFTMDQKTQDAAEKNPRWVPEISTATSASIGAHVGTHSAAEAARVIFRFGLWPAALEHWNIAPTDPRAKEWAKARWKGGELVDAGLAAAAVVGAGRHGACPQLRDRRHRPQLFPLGLVARALCVWRRTIPGRDRCAGRPEGRRKIRGSRPGQRQIPADQEQPGRPRLHLGVRYAGPRRDRARDRRAADRQGL